MKKALIVLCGTALLLVGAFSIALLTAQQPAHIAELKAFAAKENDCVNAIKALPGIAEVSINAQGCSEWERNVWARRQIVSANIFVKSSGNRLLNQSIIDTIGLIVDATFDITDMDKIIIVDTVYNLAYNGAGEALPREPAIVPPLPVINTASPGTTATPSSPALLSVDQDYIELLKKRVEVAQAELALLEAEVALRQLEASR
ncbi:MAG: hypothetical protein FWE95_06225 [Planctomycetaceae bacterium]|nr:hypothetical protein [Planctomycetaceae bacterium]